MAEASRHEQPSSNEAVLTADEPEELNDEGYGGSSSRSSLTSVMTEIRNGVVENGRIYAAYGKGEYGMPRDAQEMDRIDMAHEKYYLLLNHARYLSPISEPKAILDLGCGTGIWAMDVAEKFPSATVTGVDIAPIQPSLVPPNCNFEVDDAEEEWIFSRESFDFIFGRDLLFAIRDWPRLIAQAYDHLKPGGYLELESIYGVLCCGDDSLPQDSAFRQFDKLVRDAAAAYKTPLTDPDKWKVQFEEAGFELVVEQRFKVPSNAWPKDKRMKMIGAFERENFDVGLEGMSMRLFQKGLGWTVEETQVLLAKVRGEIKNPRYHAYYPFYVVYGRKPDVPRQA